MRKDPLWEKVLEAATKGLLASRYRSRTRVAAVKENGITLIQPNLAAGIALYGTRRTQANRIQVDEGHAVGRVDKVLRNYAPTGV